MNIDVSSLPLLVLLPFAVGALTLFLPASARTLASLLAGGVTLAGVVITILLYPAIAGGAVLKRTVSWLPQVGFDLTWRLDGVSWLFILLITGIGALVVLYSRYYMAPEDSVPRFFAYLLAFMGSMLGLVLSGNLVQMVFFWELTSLLSFLLIGYWYHNANAREGARIALIVTAIGGFLLLVGVLILGQIVGSFDLDVLLSSADTVRASPLFTPAVICILVGAFTKSAQFPFHFWLPHAMAAPTPVSAYLHSATMVKAGIFVLIRMWPVMAGSDVWYYTVTIAGLMTFLLGGLLALIQNDLKGILAYSTVSHLGLITLLLGLGTPAALGAAVFHTLNHATFKASLFMAAGIIDHETGTRDVRRLSGLMRYMPITGTLAIIAAGAMAGVPLFNGFISKEMFLTETLELHAGSFLNYGLPILATLGSMVSLLYSIRFIHQVFFGPPPTDLPREPREPVAWMRLPVEFLAVVCVVVGVIPALVVGPYLHSAMVALLGPDAPRFDLAIWHGFTPAFQLSLIALGSGALLYPLLYRFVGNRDYTIPPWAGRVRARALFDAALGGLYTASGFLSRLLGTRRLQPQLLFLALVALLAGSAPFIMNRFMNGSSGFSFGASPLTPLPPTFVVLWLVGGACAIGAAYLAKFHRLAALILTSGAGLTVCVTFVWLSAPDLAVTQLLVEIVTTVLLLLGLRWLPRRLPELAPPRREAIVAWVRRGRDLLLALAAGGGVAALAYAVMTRPVVDGISRFFVERSLPEGGGHNVVNVLLVDFRGFDTLGEITVLGVVGLTIFALLRRFRPAQEAVGRPKQQRRQEAYDIARDGHEAGDTMTDYLLVPRVVMHLMFPVITLFALYLFMRGHDEPGGGFAAGVTMAIAFILQYMAGGTRWVEERLRVLPLRWIGAGLLLAALTGISAAFFGAPFLTSAHGYLELPLIGPVPLASATLFDLGVFLLVIGATVLMLIALGHQSIRKPREADKLDSPAAGAQAGAEPSASAGSEPG